jgi:tRNA modification GTPase
VEAVRVSCTTGEGFDALADAIEARLTGGTLAWAPDLVAINARHQECLQRARAGLMAADTLLASSQPPELVAEELRAALEAVGEVVGQADAEELLGVIFGRFCIGK